MPAPTPTTTPTTSPTSPSASPVPPASPAPATPAAHPARAAHELPSLREQAERLVALGVADLAGIAPDDLRALAHAADRTDPTEPTGPADPARPDSADDSRHREPDEARPGGLLVLPPTLVPVSALAPLLRRGERAGFVVEDMTDVDEFAPIAGLDVPAEPYVLVGLDRGDDLASWSPDEAADELARRARTPLTLSEGVQWVLQAPDVLERNHCFMTIGSRRVTPRGGLDARTPAVWISNGTGRDGRERRDAPKVGWCWARNRHTWLGFASATSRETLTR
ncbi:DUF5701 family protein [Cellulomonas sp. CW35]|uniref:DUF5701 family protein n=1 Tax=Cellulomonas sp. CW35 TaxID=3458249 RepID=UPI004033B612